MFARTVVTLLTLLSLFFISVQCSGFYTIVATENIRPNSDYNISVSVHNQSEPVTIRLSIEDGDKLHKTIEMTLVNNETRLATIQLEELIFNKNHKLVAEGLSGLIFKNVSALNVEAKNCSIFIQTDKGIYKPGEKIRFRVLVLNFNFQPVSIKPNNMKVYITDAGKNRIKQYQNIELRKGVFVDELQLSEFPTLGDWEIHAEIEDEITSKTVQIAEYVLPKFEVKIDSDEHFNVKYGKIRAIIRSKYTYGKYVKGEALVSLMPTSYFAWSSRPNGDAIIKRIKIDGKGTVEFDIVDDLDIKADEYLHSVTYTLKAVVVEELTGRNQTDSKKIYVHQNRYKFNTIDRDSHFQTGTPIKVRLAITYQDDKPVTGENIPREVFVLKIPNNRNLTESNAKYELFENGTVEFYMPTTKKDESGFTLKAKYDGEESEIGYFYPRTQTDNKNLEIKVLTKNPTLNKEIFVEVESLNVLTHFTYQIISQGKLFMSDSVEVPDRKYHVFSFMATFDLAPKAHLLVYYFRGEELVSAKVDIELRDELKNFVKLKLSSQRVSPGENVAIDITSNPKSYIGLLGVDQSVLLLKNNNDLTVDGAFNERELYQYRFHDKETPEEFDQPYSSFYWRHFRSTRVILFTNALRDADYPVIRDYNSPDVFNNKAGVVASFAAPAAFHRHQPEAVVNKKPVEPEHVRKEFPETWLWQAIDEDDFNGTFTLEKQVPDTITSWVISAFSVDVENGLGLTKVPRILEVFQPFFISLNLPYSIKRGEILSVPVILFNYLEEDLVADVTLKNDHDEFEFVDKNDDESQSTLRKRSISVASNGGASCSFLIKPKKTGLITIKVSATSPLAGDAVERVLHVEPEGVEQFLTKAILVDSKSESTFTEDIASELPDKIVADSVRTEVSVVGDLLGGTIKNMGSLIRLPSGCGEQNMLHFVPNIVILNYLKSTGQIKPKIEKRAKDYTEKGYQRQLTYRHNDGSFSAFGKSDRRGSTWLTAFVAKSFRQATSYIDVDEKIITEALEWLAKIQSEDGSFKEVGQISHKAIQGGAAQSTALTAYVLTAILEARNNTNDYSEIVTKATEHISKSLDEGDYDIYSLSVAAYALQLANDPRKNDILHRLEAKESSNNDKKWFAQIEKRRRSPLTLNIEMTSYALLAMLANNQQTEGLPFFRWLLAQRNDRGGFHGTQDTVVGLTALAKFAERIYVKDNNVQLTIKPENGDEKLVSINPENALVLQTFEFSPDVRSINIDAKSHGFALVQLTHHFYVNNTDDEPSFSVKSRLTEKSSDAHLSLEVCVKYEPKTETDEKESNMAVLEVSLPSGFSVDSDIVLELSREPYVKKVETKNGDSVVVLYFDKLVQNEPVCPLINTFRIFKVAEQKPVPIIVYDYYDSSKKSREFYTIPVKSVCDICEGDFCAETCK